MDAGREAIIKALCIYLNMDPEDLVQEYMVTVGVAFSLPHLKKLVC